MNRFAGHSASILCLAGLVTGCAQTPLGPSVQVMPGSGKSFESFQVDNGNCKQFASTQVAGQADQANQRAVAIGVLGTLVGAATGAAIGGGNGAAVGAGAGTALGTGFGSGDNANSQFAIQQQYDAAFSQCMYAKGNTVPGYAPVAFVPMPGQVSMADPMVRSVQRELVRLRYMSGGADGVMGPHTTSAIVSFETSNNLPVDGSVSPDLLAHLQAVPSPTATASAPRWVQPAGSPSGAPAAIPASATATASAPAWVAPVGSGQAGTAPSSTATSGGGWVQPVKSP